ncbi:MAG: DinB family protein [Saprospiraceae bacterium]
MNKSFFQEIANYNIWANTIVHSWLNDLSEDQWNSPLVSSFGSIGATALHIVAAESIWLDRLNQLESPIWLPNTIKHPIQEMTLASWKKSSSGILKFVNTMNDPNLNETLTFKRINGEINSMKIYHVLAHIFNHSTYHRGQLTTMCRQVGYENVGSTDMLGFFRK